MEERPKRLLDRFVMPYGASTTRFALKMPTSHGSGVTSSSTTNGIRERWASQKSRPFSLIWPWKNTWLHQRKTRPLARYCSCIVRCSEKTWNVPLIYTHVLNRGGMAVRSPLDELL